MNTMNSFLENKTAMEIYYIRKQLPESATIPKPEQFKKTYAFYGDDDNIWNKPARTSKKMYQFYQKYNDENQKNLTHRQEMIFFDRIKLQERKKNLIICEREESKSRMSTRKLERKILQYESYQKLDGKCENDEELKKTLKNKELSENLLNKKIQLSLNGRVPNLWNDLNKSSMKSIKMECTMPVLQKDEEAIIAIQNKIYKSQELERVRKEFLKETRETTRSKFLQKHNENFEFQKKVGLVNETIIDNGMFKTKFINLKSPNNQKNVHIDKLSHPKSIYIPSNMLNNCTDFHGLYGATINDKTATKNNIFFVKTMLENSLATQQNVLNLKNSRPCSRETRPFTAYSTIKNPVFERTSEGYHEFDDRKFETLTQNNIEILREIDQFHKKFGRMKKVGYPNIELTSRYQDNLN